MQLAELVKSLAPTRLSGSLARDIKGIAYDSRDVRPGYIFVAIPGFKQNGHDYLTDAAARGAVAVIISQDVPVPQQLTAILVADTRKALSSVAQLFFGDPAKQLRLIGVTGTNGKTTTTLLLQHLLSSVGKGVGVVGTVKVLIGQQEYPVKHTTPEAADLQGYLAEMVAKRLDYAVMEVSSHALALDRVTGCEFDVAVFTNLTQDHLDLHQTMQAYLEAKAKLFSSLRLEGKTRKTAVLNADDPACAYLSEQLSVPRLSYGVANQADFLASDICRQRGATSFMISALGQRQRMQIATPGLFSVYNALAATAVAVHEGVPLVQVAELLATAPPVPGRFQPVYAGQDFEIVVDYAHTPDGLENVLRTARSLATGKVIVVFGCGGDRDRRKRPLMGEIAERLADLVIVTADNPRSESNEVIMAEILQGMTNAEQAVTEPDRVRAIARAVQVARTGDVVLIAGKGHETYQIFRDATIHFDDREVAKQALEARKHDEMDVKRNCHSS